jgi:hypothetical protein
MLKRRGVGSQIAIIPGRDPGRRRELDPERLLYESTKPGPGGNGVVAGDRRERADVCTVGGDRGGACATCYPFTAPADRVERPQGLCTLRAGNWGVPEAVPEPLRAIYEVGRVAGPPIRCP